MISARFGTFCENVFFNNECVFTVTQSSRHRDRLGAFADTAARKYPRK